MADRRTIDVLTPVGGWGAPWPNVAEIEAALPHEKWTLVGGHAAPRVIEKLRGKDIMAMEGGTQALRRTIDARLQITPGGTTTISVPSPFGALILKVALRILTT